MYLYSYFPLFVLQKMFVCSSSRALKLAFINASQPSHVSSFINQKHLLLWHLSTSQKILRKKLTNICFDPGTLDWNFQQIHYLSHSLHAVWGTTQWTLRWLPARQTRGCPLRWLFVQNAPGRRNVYFGRASLLPPKFGKRVKSLWRVLKENQAD